MRFDVLVRHIEASDPASFRELALLCLTARGFVAEVTDGPDDGGRDLRCYTTPPGGKHFAVQISVQRDWKGKLRDDALHAKASLGVTDMLFVSSRRLAEVDFVGVHDELAAKGVTVQKMDAQGIASLLVARGMIPQALTILGVSPVVHRPAGFERPDARQEVAWSYAFFGVEPETFRRGVLEQAVLAVLAGAGGALAVDAVVDRVSWSLGLAATQRDNVRPAIDRLRQVRRVDGSNGTVRLPDGVHREQDAVRALREQARAELLTSIADSLGPWVRAADRRQTLAEQLMADVSALLLDDARLTAAALAYDRRADSMTEAKARARRLGATLVAFGIADNEDHRSALVAVTDAVRRSTLGRYLLAGEVFVNLLSLRTSQFVAAIGARRSLRVVLDASVAMPLLAALLYEPVAQRYSVAAYHAWQQIRGHGIEVMVPSDHVEEMASHLLEAWHYRDLVGDEPDLKASQNSFVSHFQGLGARGRRAGESGPEAFERYLEGYGHRASFERMDFVVARRTVERQIENLLDRYSLRVERLGAPPGIDEVRAGLERVMEDWQADTSRPPSRAMRPDILLRHDARTIAWLQSLVPADAGATVFCTWDRLIFDFHERMSAMWQALTPSQLGDVLMLAAPDADSPGAAPVSVLDLALSLADEDAARGALVLDRLVRLERDTQHDARLFAEMRRFKGEWLRSSHPHTLEHAWAEWKREHLAAAPAESPGVPPRGGTS